MLVKKGDIVEIGCKPRFHIDVAVKHSNPTTYKDFRQNGGDTSFYAVAYADFDSDDKICPVHKIVGNKLYHFYGDSVGVRRIVSPEEYDKLGIRICDLYFGEK